METFLNTMPRAYIIHHQCCDGSADLIIRLRLSLRSQENKQESVGDGKQPFHITSRSLREACWKTLHCTLDLGSSSECNEDWLVHKECFSVNLLNCGALYLRFDRNTYFFLVFISFTYSQFCTTLRIFCTSCSIYTAFHNNTSHILLSTLCFAIRISLVYPDFQM